MMMMGGDFQYQNAHINYKNIDKLINYVNAAAVCWAYIWLFAKFAGINGSFCLICWS